MNEANHSDTFLRRNNNPEGRFKSEAEHIKHVQERLKERFNIEISIDEYYTLLEKAQKNHKKVYKLSHEIAIWEIEIHGITVWILYGGKGKNHFGDLPARFKTVLTPNKHYPVPLKLAHVYDNYSFTEEIKKTLLKFEELSLEIDLNDKKSFFLRDIPAGLKHGALRMRQGVAQNSTLISIAVGHLMKENNQIDEE